MAREGGGSGGWWLGRVEACECVGWKSGGLGGW